MIDALALTFRGLQLLSGCAVVGVLSFALLRRAGGLPLLPLYRPILALAAGFILAGVGALLSQAAVVTGDSKDFWNIAVWEELLSSTRFGQVWRWREGLMLMVLASAASRVIFPHLAQEQRQLACTWAVAVVALALAAAAGHAAAYEPAWPLMISHALHLTAVAVWVGALPLLVFELRRAARDYSRAPATAQLFQRFVRMASISMLLIVASGAVLALAHVASFSALLGTRYGLCLSAKLFFVALALGVAARLRWAYLRSFSDMPPGLAARRAWRLVALEFAFACCALLCACVLGTQPQARHEEIIWWLPFRFAPSLTWGTPGVEWQLASGLSSMAIGAWLFLLWLRGRKRLLLAATVVSLAGLGVTLRPLAIPAFPDTYRSSTVVYHAASIHAGAELYRQRCSGCHGSAGAGDGPIGLTLPKRPADLSAQRAAQRTAGELFWWAGHGGAEADLSGSEQGLSEDERWDVVNFLLTLSSANQARAIGPAAVPGKPWLAAPDFDYLTQYGVAGTLKEFRGKKPVMLVLFGWPQSKARLDWLNDNRSAIQDNGAEFIAVPMSTIPDKDLRGIRVPLAVRGADEISSSYRVLARALSSGADKGPPALHVEFLIDRFGYIRARWLQGESVEWNDASFIANQIQRLSVEQEILSPPDEHIH